MPKPGLRAQANRFAEIVSGSSFRLNVASNAAAHRGTRSVFRVFHEPRIVDVDRLPVTSLVEQAELVAISETRFLCFHFIHSPNSRFSGAGLTLTQTAGSSRKSGSLHCPSRI